MSNRMMAAAVIILCIVVLLAVFQPTIIEDTVNGMIQTAERKNNEPEGEKSPFSFPDSTPLSDNPWGKSSGMIDSEETGKAAFLTPGSHCVISELPNEMICLDMMIHPAIRETSDGVNAVLRIYGKDHSIVEEQVTFVSPE